MQLSFPYSIDNFFSFLSSSSGPLETLNVGFLPSRPLWEKGRGSKEKNFEIFPICIPSLQRKSPQGSGKSLIYQENSNCFFFWPFLECLCYGSGWNYCISYKSRLVLHHYIYIYILYSIIIVLGWVQASFSMT